MHPFFSLLNRKNKKVLTNKKVGSIVGYKFNIKETDEAEITAMMPLQRACVAESQVRNKLSNGPLRAQPKA